MALFSGCAFVAPRYQGPRSDHFDGQRFFNPQGPPEQGAGALFKWLTHREQGPWHEVEDAVPGPMPPWRVKDGELRVTFVGHSSVLIQLDGLNLLTDPVWSERVGPLPFAGPKRVRPPGIRFEDLPPIDVVLVSHNHYDHCDVPTLERLQDAFRPRIYAGLGNSLLFAQRHLRNAHDLDWWQSAELGHGVILTAVPAQHFSNRGLTDHNGTLWTGFAIRGKGGYVYFAGDTGFGPHFQQLRERLGPPRLAVLPIGAYRPEWFMAPVHISPAEAVKAHQALGAWRSVAMHFGTFALADDGQTDAPEQLGVALRQAGVPEGRFWVLGFGEGRDVPPQEETR